MSRFKLLTIGGIRKRMFVGFVSIVLLLFFSGMVSLFELGRVSNDTEEILLASKSNVELAGEMISALNEQNDARYVWPLSARTRSPIAMSARMP